MNVLERETQPNGIKPNESNERTRTTESNRGIRRQDLPFRTKHLYTNTCVCVYIHIHTLPSQPYSCILVAAPESCDGCNRDAAIRRNEKERKALPPPANILAPVPLSLSLSFYFSSYPCLPLKSCRYTPFLGERLESAGHAHRQPNKKGGCQASEVGKQSPCTKKKNLQILNLHCGKQNSFKMEKFSLKIDFQDIINRMVNVLTIMYIKLKHIYIFSHLSNISHYALFQLNYLKRNVSVRFAVGVRAAVRKLDSM